MQVRALSVVYPGGVTALERLDLAFVGGSVSALIGPNGSGKSTLLKILAGVLRPTSGAIETPPGAGFGYAAQDPALDPDMSGADTFALFAALHRIPRRRRAAAIGAIAARFGLTEHQPRPIAGYSGGLRRRLHLALVWLADPKLLLLDEPTADLDPAGRALVWELIAERAAAGATVVVATHDLAQVERHCARAVVLERGRALADDSPAELARVHAGQRMLLQLTSVPTDPGAVEASVRALAGISAARCRGDQVTIELEPGVRPQDHVAAVLTCIGHELSGISVLQQDLEGAYFQLTGRIPTQSAEER